jgi:hypothetical protein
MSSEQGWGVWIVNERRWRRATCDAFEDSAVVYRNKADAEAEANTMEQMGFGECVASPFDWSAENEEGSEKE